MISPDVDWMGTLKGMNGRPTQVNEIQDAMQNTIARRKQRRARDELSLLDQQTVGCGAEVVMHARYAVHMHLLATRKTRCVTWMLAKGS